MMEYEKQQSDQEERELRRGPWTVDEDLILMNHISKHGEGRWNSLAKCAGLKRTGKSCRLRWLNYLRPDVRRGNITPEEQLLILDLQSRWGNRWSKIAQHLPGRTDNEIKNYWRTRVQKHAKLLHCDVNSRRFRDAMNFIWMPRLLERIRGAGASANNSTVLSAAGAVAFSTFSPNSMAATFPESSVSNTTVIAGGGFSSPPAAAAFGAKSGDCGLQRAQSGGWWSDLPEGNDNLQGLWDVEDMEGYLWNDENVSCL